MVLTDHVQTLRRSVPPPISEERQGRAGKDGFMEVQARHQGVVMARGQGGILVVGHVRSFVVVLASPGATPNILGASGARSQGQAN